MVKRVKIMLLLAGVAAACAGLAACQALTPPEHYENEGYVITVTYDPNGGEFQGRDGVTIMDMFRPSDYAADEDGNISIVPRDPTDPKRPSGSSSDPITLTRTGYSLVGWYTERTMNTDGNGNPVDDWGNSLSVDGDNNYYYIDESGAHVASYPSFTYSGLWNFGEDSVVYSGDGTEKLELTLYAGWIPYFEFNYYYESDGEWTQYGSTTFDWKTTYAEDSTTADYNTLWVPEWNNGAMDYSHSYSNSSTYNFPRRDGYTFDAAYSDDERLNKITDTFVHVGTVDYQTGTATNFRQNIYVDFLEGTRYRIETAEQLSVNGDESGYYEILDDLDFENGKISWPASLMAGNFTGRFEAAEQVTISNVLVTFARTGASDTQGGLFGTVEEEAVISNISFENVTFDLATVRQRLRNTRFGVFSGEIVEGAQITNVSLTGATMRIGSVTLGDGFAINLVANGDKSGLTYAPVTFVIYGSDLLTEDTPDVRYRYMINFELDASGAPTGITVDDEYNVTLTFATNNRKGSPEYTINYLEATNNE